MSEKVVFITGASSGIGRAAAIAFCRAGYHVCGFARRAERLDVLGVEIKALNEPKGEYIAAAGDVRRVEDLRAAVETTLARFGRLDILVANAGLGQQGALAEAEWDHLETVLRTNIDGALHSIRVCVPALRTSGGGQIMIVSSIVAGLHTPYTATYSASKAFASSLAGSLRLELEGDNIAVTDVLVGLTITEFNENRLGSKPGNRGRLPTKTADDVAEALVKAAQGQPRHVIMRLFDRLVLAGGVLLPAVMARLTWRRYQVKDAN